MKMRTAHVEIVDLAFEGIDLRLRRHVDCFLCPVEPHAFGEAIVEFLTAVLMPLLDGRYGFNDR